MGSLNMMARDEKARIEVFARAWLLKDQADRTLAALGLGAKSV